MHKGSDVWCTVLLMIMLCRSWLHLKRKNPGRVRERLRVGERCASGPAFLSRTTMSASSMSSNELAGTCVIASQVTTACQQRVSKGRAIRLTSIENALRTCLTSDACTLSLALRMMRTPDPLQMIRMNLLRVDSTSFEYVCQRAHGIRINFDRRNDQDSERHVRFSHSQTMRTSPAASLSVRPTRRCP